MGRNIFVSYKYADDQVQHLYGCWPTTVRDYVDTLIDKLDETDYIYCGEDTDEDLSHLSDDEIYDVLKDKIYPTTVTLVLISPHMKDPDKLDKSQWIPWEIYYSLRETTRHGRTSHRNAVIAVVLPDKDGRYDYMMEEEHCCLGGCQSINTHKLFNILRYNMFNRKNDEGSVCENGDKIYHGWSSYIHMVKWCDFIEDINYYIGIAEDIMYDHEGYELHLSVNAK